MVWHLMLRLGGRREGIVGRLGILAAVALGRVRTALGCVEVGVFLGAGDVAKRARLADVRRQRRRRLGGRGRATAATLETRAALQLALRKTASLLASARA